MMRRRAAAWPLAARAQQPASPVIGWLRAGAPPDEDYFKWLRQGLNDLGYLEGRNVAIEVRSADAMESDQTSKMLSSGPSRF
jgi:putative ABC transport system substrate-binding protein